MPGPCTMSTGPGFEETVAGAYTSTSLAGCSFPTDAVSSALDCDFSASISCCCAAICFCVCDRASRTAFSSAATSESFVGESVFWGLDCAHRNPGAINTKHRARNTFIVATPSFPPSIWRCESPQGWMNTQIPNADKCGRDRLTTNCTNHPLQAPLPRQLPEGALGKASNLV